MLYLISNHSKTRNKLQTFSESNCSEQSLSRFLFRSKLLSLHIPFYSSTFSRIFYIVSNQHFHLLHLLSTLIYGIYFRSSNPITLLANIIIHIASSSSSSGVNYNNLVDTYFPSMSSPSSIHERAEPSECIAPIRKRALNNSHYLHKNIDHHAQNVKTDIDESDTCVQRRHHSLQHSLHRRLYYHLEEIQR